MLKRISPEEVRRLFSYDPESGIITWKIGNSKRIRAGDIAGTVSSRGYRSVEIYGGHYLAHRIAWCFVHGAWPRLIDHKDGDMLNNRLSNLREATTSQNAANKKMNCTNRCGYKGVRSAKNNRWRATIETNKKSIHLGIFDTPEEAHAAYASAAKKLFGEFARTT